DEWAAAQLPAVVGKAPRGQPRGRVGKHTNLFGVGMLRNARDGGTYIPSTRVDRGNHHRTLIPSAKLDGRGEPASFPLPVFEEAILTRLREIDPHEILNGDQGPDETLALSGELAKVAASIASIEQEMDAHGESPTLYRRLRAKEDEHRELTERL